MTRLGLALVVVAALGCRVREPVAPPGSTGVVRGTLAHPDAPAKQVEYFWARPAGDGPWPALIYIHGHQGDRVGARDMVANGVLERMARTRGVVAVAVSQPGYGESDGPPDYCGPFTQRAVHAVIAELRGWPFVNPDKIGLYGVSRGAIVAGMVETQDPRLAAAVLIVGWYDFEAGYRRMVELGETEGGEARGIAANIAAESGGTADDFRARSAILGADRIRTPTLILNGAKDFRASIPEVLELERRIQQNGVPARAVVYPEHGHFIPIEQRNREILPFLEQHLGLAREGT